MPWVHLHVDSNGLVKACCNANITFGNVNQKTLHEIWNDQPIRAFRKKQMEGAWDKRCRSCIQKEAAGKQSMRTETLDKFDHKRYWVENTDDEGFTDLAKPIYFDIRFNNLCNLRCRTCWHGASSSWFEEAKILKNNLGDKAIIQATSDNQALIDQLIAQADEIEEVYFAGGEPLMMQEHYDLLEQLIAGGKSDVRLRYNTNLSQLHLKGRSVVELWKSFKNITISASIDGLDKQAEYVRKGLVWDRFVESMRTIAFDLPHVKLEIAPTISVFNILKLPELHRYFVSSGLIPVDAIYLNLLSRPDYYNIKVLTPELKQKAKSLLEKHMAWLQDQGASDLLISEFNALIKFMSCEDWTFRLPALKKHLKLLDGLRSESFEDTFPELAANW